MKVGDFVRFNHAIATNNGGMLNRERGIVVGFEKSAKEAALVRLVWDDGTPAIVPQRKLVRTEGQVGKAVYAPKRPLKDKGVKPHVAPPRVVHTPLPVDNACWAIVDEYEVQGFVPEPTPQRPEPGFMRFAVPIKVIAVKASHWPDGSGVIKLSRSEKSLMVTWPNGDKRSMTPTGARAWMFERFGPEMGGTLAGMTRVGA